MIQARTAYNVPIAKWFPSTPEAVAWAERIGRQLFPGLRIVELVGEDQTVTLWQEQAK